MSKSLLGGYQIIDVSSKGIESISNLPTDFPEEWKIIKSYIKDVNFTEKVIRKPILLLCVIDSCLCACLMSGVSDDKADITGFVTPNGYEPVSVNISTSGAINYFTLSEQISDLISDGQISVEPPLEEVDMTALDLSVNTTSTYVQITHTDDDVSVLGTIIGKYLNGYDSDGELVARGLIIAVDDASLATTLIATGNIAGVTTWKIFNQ